MYETVLAVINNNQASWNGIPAFSSLVTEYSTKLQQLKDFSMEQGSVLLGVTSAKDELRDETIEKARVLVGALKAFALSTDDVQLAEQVNISKSRFAKLSQLAFKHQIDQLIALAEVHLTELEDFGIDQQKVDELQDLRDACEEAFGSPRQAIVDRKTITKSIEMRIRDLDKILRKGIDGLMIAFKESVPDFYFHYKSARIIVDVRGKGSAPTEEGTGDPL